MPRFDGRWFPSSKTSDWAAGKFGTPGWYPGPPTGLTPVEGDGQIALSWDAGNANGSDIIGYKVEKNDGSWSTVVSDTGSTATSYTVTGLTNGTAHTFRITAINGVGEGAAPSAVSGSKTPRGVPGAPGTLSLAAGSDPQTQVNLSWSAGSINGAAITGYKVQYSTNGSSWSNVTADTGSAATTYTVSSLTLATQYWFRVAAINAAGAGSYGNEPNITTAAAMAWTYSGSYTTGTDGGNTWIKMTSTGNFVVSNASATADIFVLGAGGSGATAGGTAYGPYPGAGGGGGGGTVTTTGVTVGIATHTVTIGQGGTSNGNNGNNSSFAVNGASTYTGTGGGGGKNNGNGNNGGCGGGAGSLSGSTGSGGTGSQGGDGGGSINSGTNYGWGGGGGGMGGDGTTPGEWAAGAGGGDGSNSYVGSAFLHSGGGGACTPGFYNGTAGGTTGTAGNRGGNSSAAGANTGGGTGGGGTSSATGVGGSGAVIIRFPTP